MAASKSSRSTAELVKTEIAGREDNEVSVHIEIDSEMVDRYFNDTYKKLSKDVSVPGFRRGKAPRMLLKSRVGAEHIGKAVLEELVPIAIHEAIEKLSLQPLGAPDLKEIKEIEEGKALIFDTTIPVRPDVILGPYKGLKIKALRKEVTPDDIQQTLEKLREQKTTLEKAEDRGCRNGDMVTLDYEILSEDVETETKSEKDLTLELGAPGWLPGIEDQVAGLKAGETKEITISIPDDFQNEAMRGKKVTMKVTITNVQEKKYPEMNDEFAKSLGAYENLEALKIKINESLDHSREDEYKTRARTKAMDFIMGATEIEIPKKMIEREAQFLENNFVERLGWEKKTLEDYAGEENKSVEEIRDDFKEQAYKNVKMGFMIDEIAKIEKVEVTEDEVSEEIASMVRRFRLDRATAQKLFTDEDRISRIQYDIMHRKTIDHIVDSAKLEPAAGEDEESVTPAEPEETAESNKEISALDTPTGEESAKIDDDKAEKQEESEKE